jgi:hypothetical protein
MYFRNKFVVSINTDVEAKHRLLVKVGASILFCESEGVPTHDTNGLPITDDRWELCDKEDVSDLGCIHLFTMNDVRYYGYL